jgi:hypothetical protein
MQSKQEGKKIKACIVEGRRNSQKTKNKKETTPSIQNYKQPKQQKNPSF